VFTSVTSQLHESHDLYIRVNQNWSKNRDWALERIVVTTRQANIELSPVSDTFAAVLINLPH